MITSVSLSWLTLIIPTYLGSVVYHWGLYFAWSFITLYIMLLGIFFLKRFLDGKWETMRVIEETPMPIVSGLPENPPA